MDEKPEKASTPPLFYNWCHCNKWDFINHPSRGAPEQVLKSSKGNIDDKITQFSRCLVERHEKNLQRWKKLLRQKRKGNELNFLSLLLVSGGIIWSLENFIRTGKLVSTSSKKLILGHYKGDILAHNICYVLIVRIESWI